MLNTLEKAEKKRKDIIPLPKTKTFVEASFSQLHELTSMLGKFKHSMSEDQNNKGLVKVYYEENPPHLSMHTLGGFRYFAHTQIPILAIFPIQDGVIIKCRYDDRLIKVSFNRMANSPSYAYLTLTKHPLEDLHPLSIRNTSLEETRDMINWNQDLLFISDKLPIAIFFDEDTSHLAFNIIRNTKRNPDQTETLKEDMNDKKESEFDIFFQKRRHKLLAQISDYKEIVLYPIGSDRLKEGIKPDHFEIIDSIEDNIFFILAHITELQQVRFYRCQIIDEKKIFSIKLIAYKSKCVKMESFEFLKQENLSLPQICSSPQFTRNPEAEKFKKIMKREFNKEAIILDTEGNLKIYKGDCSLLTLSASNEIPNFLDMKIPEGGVITNISNPQKSRLTFHFEQESFRVDFQFKGKLRDYNLLSCLHVMHKILPLQVFWKFYQHFIYLVFISSKNSSVSAWKIFIDLFFTILERRTKKPFVHPASKPKMSAFDKMISSKTSKKFLKGLKPVIKLQHQTMDCKEEANLCYEKLHNSFTPSDFKEFQASANDLFEVLHLMHEDYKLNIFKHKLLNEGTLGEFLFKFCLKLGSKRFNYSEFYLKEYPELAKKFSTDLEMYTDQFKKDLANAKEMMQENRHDDNFIVPDIFLNIATVPSIYSWVEAKLNPDQANYNGNYLCFFETSRKIGRLFDIFTQNKDITTCQIHPLLYIPKKDDDMGIDSNEFLSNTKLFGVTEDQQDLVYETGGDNLLKKIVFWLKEERIGRDSIKKLPLGISLPIQEVLSHEYFQTIYVKSSEIEKKFIEEWPKEIFKLIEREDLYYNLKELKKTKNYTEEIDAEFQFSRISSLNLNKTLSKRKSVLKLGRTESNAFANIKSSVLNDRNSIKNKQTLIQNTGDSETQEYMNLIDKEFQRLGLKNNQMSNMVGKVSEGNFISYRFSSDLRYMEVSLMLDSSIPFKLRIDNLDIDQMSPEKAEETRQHLHLNCITRQFAKCVGRGALKLGTIHTVPTEKLKIPEICMTALLPPSNKKSSLREGINPSAGWAEFHNGVATGLQLATEFDPFSNQIKNWILYHRPPVVKDEFGGFLMSMGFHGYLKCFQKIEIYQYMKTKHEAYTVGLCLGGAASLIGTGDEQFSKALCINISHLHPRNLDIEISTPTQCSALIGEGLLFKGSNDRAVSEMLLSQIGKRPANSKSTERESYTIAAGFGLGIVNLGCGTDLPGMSDLNIDERLIRFVEGGKNMPEIFSFKGGDGPEDQCSSIREGENVNLYVTLPGGIVALALIHLKTNNKKIADRITLPKTFFALEYSRPSDVLLKVLCKNLIMWDSIDASNAWLKSQIPEIISTIYLEKDIEAVERLYQTRISPEEIDYANIAMQYTYFLTGSLFSIGFKYAGSGNRDVFKFLCHHTEKLINMKITNSTQIKANISPKYTNANKNDIDAKTYQSWLCVAAYAISMVVAGTGDVDAFIILRRIRKILEPKMHYGFNMAIHMSIGFLFLGSGKYTFSTSNLSIAALLMALYPNFPENSNDNRYHLQALRHFYVLAIENKLLQTVDVETGELVSVPLEIKYKNSIKDPNCFVDALIDIRNVKTPIMLEDMHKISRIQLSDKKYYEIVIDKPEVLSSHLQKGSHSVFQRASYLVDQPELQWQKSSSKISMNSPFEINSETSEISWIPKMIYVKKRIPLETENSSCDKIYLSPFEFAKDLLQISSKTTLNEESKGEVDSDEDEEESEIFDSTHSSITSNKFFSEISEITKNPILQRFLKVLCYYDNVIYSELEPTISKGINGRVPEGESYSSMISPENYIEIMSETENLVDDLEDDCKKTRVFQKEFNLGILHECFIKSRIEVLPTYLRLFANSLELKKFENPEPLIREARLVLMFYKGLYQTSFNQPEISVDLDDVAENSENESLINKRFLEELQEVMNLCSNSSSDPQGPFQVGPSSFTAEVNSPNQALLEELLELI